MYTTSGIRLVSMNKKTFEYRFKPDDVVYVIQNDYSVKKGTVNSVTHTTYAHGNDALWYNVTSNSRAETYQESCVFATAEEAFK